MEMKVFWTDTARNQLEDIFKYYKEKANLKTSKRLIGKILDRTIQLEKNPFSGTIEPILQNRKFEYRFLVERHYKIIYWIEDNYVKIASIFDCRQNPIKMNNIK
jgi:plasmid stabilization system protein ParE